MFMNFLRPVTQEKLLNTMLETPPFLPIPGFDVSLTLKTKKLTHMTRNVMYHGLNPEVTHV
jgi:hypothetical protein